MVRIQPVAYVVLKRKEDINMFQGTLPQSCIKIVSKLVQEWKTDRIYVGCSGNFTIERSISKVTKCPITSNDVTIYSSYIGEFFAGHSLDGLQIRSEFAQKYKLFGQYMETDIDKVATLLLAADMLTYDKPGVYYERMYQAYEQQFPVMHAKLKKKLQECKTNIDSFYCGDVMDLLDSVGPNDGFVSFPPFYSGGYEKMWSRLEQVFFYDRPQYTEFDPDAVMEAFVEKVKKLNNFCICMERPIPSLSDYVVGQSVTNKGKAIYIYGKSSKKHFIETRIKQTNGTPIRKITADYKLTGDIKIKKLTVDQFIENKALYLSMRVASTANPNAMFGLYDGDRCFGFFGFASGYMFGCPNGYEGPSIYLMCDFAVAPTCEKHLSKLVLMCILSKEVQMIAERMTSKQINLIHTNVFSKNPVSMKYRGIFELALGTVQEKDENGKPTLYDLSYVAKPGQWTLQEGYKIWRQKYSR